MRLLTWHHSWVPISVLHPRLWVRLSLILRLAWLVWPEQASSLLMQQKALVQSFVEAGDTAGAQGVILDISE